MNADAPLAITELAHNGCGLGFLAGAGDRRGKAVFVSGALPGQIVTWRPIHDKKKFIEAKLCSVIAGNDKLAQPICAHFLECGGCPLQRLPYPEQLYWKQHLAREALVRIGGLKRALVDNSWHEIRPAAGLRQQRNKIELAFGRDEQGHPILGFRRQRSHSVIAARDCALLDGEALAIVDAAVASANAAGVKSDFFRHLVLRKSRTLESSEFAWHCLLVTSVDKGARQAAVKMAEGLIGAGAASFAHAERIGPGLVARGDRRVFTRFRSGHANSALALELGGRLFEIDHESFFQVNSATAEEMAAIICALDRPGGAMLDLYCGVGAPGQLLAQNHDTCLGIEIDKTAVTLACRNAAREGIRGWTYSANQVAAGLARAVNGKMNFELALVDPPRQGMDGLALANLMRIAPRSIIYVSCNPATLARDARQLCSAYELTALYPVDMFPHTIHLECISYWRRKS